MLVFMLVFILVVILSLVLMVLLFLCNNYYAAITVVTVMASSGGASAFCLRVQPRDYCWFYCLPLITGTFVAGVVSCRFACDCFCMPNV
jgi:hypothetical protein